jgi:hypothetical protein
LSSLTQKISVTAKGSLVTKLFFPALRVPGPCGKSCSIWRQSGLPREPDAARVGALSANRPLKNMIDINALAFER